MKTSYTILYVEDDLDDLLLISEAFSKYTDYLKVVHAHNGREALQALQKMKQEDRLPCLIILDINMPIMNGKETLGQLRQQTAFDGIPVVMFSTSNSAADRLFAHSLNADFMTKPVTYTDMEALVREFVNKCRLESVARF